MSTQKYITNAVFLKENLFAENSVKSNIIYTTVVIAVLATLALLPIIKVSLSIQGRGIIRPTTEKAEIKAIQSELVVSIYVSEGQFINKGDTILKLRQDMLLSKQNFIQSEIYKKQGYINDLARLTSKEMASPISDYYLGIFNSFKQKLSEIENKIAKANTELDRNKSLFDKEFISSKEYDDLQFNVNQLQKEKKTIISSQLAQWKADLEEFTTTINELKNQLVEIKKQKQFYIIKAPVSGTIEEFSGIYEGSILQAGQTIAVISPISEKIAEVFVSAKDIGYLKKGQKTKIQVDAFNYNQWGSIHGEIIDISDDFILVNNAPSFKIKCKLHNEYLELKNGVKGNLKKGMTINARFMISKRSIFQLLYQKSDDWLNPSRSLTPENQMLKE